MTKRHLVALAVVLLLAFAFPLATAFADEGADLYKSKCAMCHGATGAGDTAMGKKLGVKALTTADVKKMSDDQLKTTISNGRNKMPAFGTKLTAPQIAAVIKHIRTLH